MISAEYTLITHLNQLEQSIKKVEKYKKEIDKKKFLESGLYQDALVHNLGRVVEAMLTIGNMIIAEESLKKPEVKEEIFQILEKEKIITQKLADALKGAAGFRNVLIHNYVDLDLDLVYRNIEKGLPVFREFLSQIAKYIKRR
jgi:uncharacterized protein YutE (UPF0331/DUF86 family)